MASATELLRRGSKAEIWQKYCGFLDLSITEFMEVQRRLLEEQLPLLTESPLGRTILRDAHPRTLEEFRAVAPFTTYEDYSEFLIEQDESVLPAKPYLWAHTSGRSYENDLKWIPYTEQMYRAGGEFAMAVFLLSCSKRKGDVVLRERMRCPYTIAPPPYISGIFLESLMDQFNFRLFPSKERAAAMDFHERVQESFRIALNEGLDFFYGVTSILLATTESFSRLGETSRLAAFRSLSLRGALRIARALLLSRLRRRQLLPKDIWKVKGAACGGMDTAVFKAKVAESWGVVPLEAYGSTELGISATQTWRYEGLTFSPNISFWEFISEEDYRRFTRDSHYRPKALLMSEVKAGSEYVLVGTSLHGGALVRYIIGDLIRITALRDDDAGVQLPQALFVSRIDDVIDVGGFTRLTEKTIWHAIANSGVDYADWTIRKEFEDNRPVLHLYLESTDGVMDPAYISERIHATLREVDAPYKSLEEMTGLRPLKVTLLTRGTFQRYYEERQASGADLAHLKPPHINPSDEVIRQMLEMSSWSL